MKKWHLLWLIPVLILLSPILIVLIVIAFFDDRKDAAKAKAFWQENLNKTFFFYGNKRGWRSFVINNIIPMLPPYTTVYSIGGNSPITEVNRILSMRKGSTGSVKIPFIITLKENEPIVYSFNEDFGKMRQQFAKRNPEVQEKVKAKLAEKVSTHPQFNGQDFKFRPAGTES